MTPWERAHLRRFIYPRHRVDAEGKRVCSVLDCDNVLPKGRRSWCSNEHMRLGYGTLSRFAGAVFYYAKGRCALCGLDCGELRRWMDHYAAMEPALKHPLYLAAWERLEALGFNRESALSEADHIIPVSCGGATTLENGRLLCRPCHKSVTNELRRRKRRVVA